MKTIKLLLILAVCCSTVSAAQAHVVSMQHGAWDQGSWDSVEHVSNPIPDSVPGYDVGKQYQTPLDGVSAFSHDVNPSLTASDFVQDYAY